MYSVFQVEWAHLGVEDIRAFFDTAGDEGLTWEAKAGKIDTRSIGEAVCGFANSVGGFLVLGVEGGKGESWTLPGVSLPDSEPLAWASRVITDRTRPTPKFDVKAWSKDGGRHVVVIRVEPTPVPPCLTVDGLAFERVTSQTIKIKDPAVLADLLRRGEAAREAALARARAATRQVEDPAPIASDLHLSEVTRFCLGLSAVGGPSNVSARLFSQRFMNRLYEVVRSVLLDAGQVREWGSPRLVPDHLHTMLKCRVELPWPTMPMRQHYLIEAHRDGSVGIRWESSTQNISIESLANEQVRGAWRGATALVMELGGYGDGILTMRSRAADRATSGLATMDECLERWVDLDDPESLDLASVARELTRAAGYAAYEPEETEPRA